MFLRKLRTRSEVHGVTTSCSPPRERQLRCECSFDLMMPFTVLCKLLIEVGVRLFELSPLCSEVGIRSLRDVCE
jgi:hypothetical protein